VSRASELLRLAHRSPGITRAEAAARLSLRSGSATEVMDRLRTARLLAETPTRPRGGRGRPTAVLGPHPEGPLVAVVEITHETFSVTTASIGGALAPAPVHRGPSLDLVFAALASLRRSYGSRVRAIGVAVPGIIRGTTVVQATNLGWHDVELAGLATAGGPPLPLVVGNDASPAGAPLPLVVGNDASPAGVPLPLVVGNDASPAGVPLPLVVGNDASLAGVAEALRGAAQGVGVALHLTVEVGVGGILLVDGRPVLGANGAGGEFGHMPFGDPAQRCPCGARGCWDLTVDGRAMARHLRRRPPADPRSYAGQLVAAARAGEPAATGAVRAAASALGRGIGALVNALDPAVVTLGGLGIDLLDVAERPLTEAARAAVMAFRRTNLPPIVPAALGDHGPAIGAAETAFAEILETLVSAPSIG
jgi:predicted NBD/HSP70 family sugar kinase